MKSALDQSYSIASNSFVSSDKPQAVGCRCFYTDLISAKMEMFCQACLHGLNMGSKFWSLGDDGGVNIANDPPLLLEQIIGIVKEDCAGFIFPARIV